jgi:long-chain acyl-CoA synthetase
MAVSPASVIRHPWPGAAVDDVVVFGIPHDELGEEIKAVVQPAAGLSPARR